MQVIGLTGGIGAGKSTVAEKLAELGAHVIDADKLGHEAYKQGSIGYGRVITFFGTDILDKDGEVDRKQLADIVFGNPDALALLNSAVHPLIKTRIQQEIARLKDDGAQVAVVDAAVLYEAGWDKLVDEVWAVTAPASLVIPRLEARGMTKFEAQRRIRTQDDPAKLAAIADVVIENTGALEDLQAKVKQLWTERISLIRQ